MTADRFRVAAALFGSLWSGCNSAAVEAPPIEADDVADLGISVDLPVAAQSVRTAETPEPALVVAPRGFDPKRFSDWPARFVSVLEKPERRPKPTGVLADLELQLVPIGDFMLLRLENRGRDRAWWCTREYLRVDFWDAETGEHIPVHRCRHGHGRGWWVNDCSEMPPPGPWSLAPGESIAVAIARARVDDVHAERLIVELVDHLLPEGHCLFIYRPDVRLRATWRIEFGRFRSQRGPDLENSCREAATKLWYERSPHRDDERPWQSGESYPWVFPPRVEGLDEMLLSGELRSNVIGLVPYADIMEQPP